MIDLFITRQAILNSHNEVMGYELLYHDGNTKQAHPCSDAEQSAQLIVNAFLGFGLENLVGSSKAFINLSHDFFTNAHPIPMASYQVVLEVPGACIEDDAVYAEIKQLSTQGYTFSLYDYDYNEKSAERLDAIDIIKLDLANYDIQALKEQTRYYRNHGKRIHIKGVETDSQQLLCSQLGIDYFQGTALSVIDHLMTRTSPCNANVLKTLANNRGSTPDALASIASQDIALCFKLLRYINCASFSERSEIHSLPQALQLIGSSTLSQWAALCLIACSETYEGGTEATSALHRANACRELARKAGNIDIESAFLVGLLADLGSEMEKPLEDLLDSLALSPDIAFALLFGEGALGELLESSNINNINELNSNIV
ncbi:MAG: HDOD domain-containing protein [Chromatiales bacterium]|nr:HDOD domain-containing protein [Chromatiales bacterium]